MAVDELTPAGGFARSLAAARNQVSSCPDTAYSQFLRETSRQVISNLVVRDPLFGSLRVLLLGGDAAYGVAAPYRNNVAGMKIPPQTEVLWRLIYLWQFVFFAKAADLPRTRFLDADLSSELELHFYFDGDSVPPVDKLRAHFEAEFTNLAGFSPPVRCRAKTVDALHPSDFLRRECIYGEIPLDAALPEGAANPAYFGAVAFISDYLRTAAPVDSSQDEIISTYRRVRANPEFAVCVDHLSDEVKGRSRWHRQNRRFFERLLTGEFDRIEVRDVTKNLNDRRNPEKENRFTIVKVLGLRAGDDFIPATDVVLKLRGLSYFRGEINNQVDILKEYASYVYIHNQVREPSPYILDVGPLLLSAEKLDLPLDLSERRRLIGIFLEEIRPPDDGEMFSCRLKFLPDFWAPSRAFDRVWKSVTDANFRINAGQLRKWLRSLRFWLFRRGLSIDYCDMTLKLDSQRNIMGLVIFDFERLSFGELVGEQHLVLDVFIDLKRRLSKEHWLAVLDRVYLSAERGAGFESLEQVRSYLYPLNRKRQFLLKVARKAGRYSSLW